MQPILQALEKANHLCPNRVKNPRDSRYYVAQISHVTLATYC